MEGALALVHHVRPLGRERLGLSVGLKGNGMCFCWDVTKRVAWRGGSLTEDIEYTVDLALDSGIRVRYVPGAIVYAEMPSSQQGAQSQRVRWEAGRRDVLRRLGRRMLTASRTSMIVRDLLIDLILPPMAELAAMIAILVVLTAVAPYVRLSMEISGTVSALAFAALAVYVVGGFRVGGAPRDAYRALVMAPFYIIWKIIVVLLAALARKPLTWVRTARRGEAKPASGAGSTRP
jgi:cellulose synthase/poly-beta-1,6-N-acetylglucosamine synthase-like glycosyltransferase